MLSILFAIILFLAKTAVVVFVIMFIIGVIGTARENKNSIDTDFMLDID
jgi:hypothetical protein